MYTNYNKTNLHIASWQMKLVFVFLAAQFCFAQKEGIYKNFKAFKENKLIAPYKTANIRPLGFNLQIEYRDTVKNRDVIYKCNAHNCWGFYHNTLLYRFARHKALEVVYQGQGGVIYKYVKTLERINILGDRGNVYNYVDYDVYYLSKTLNSKPIKLTIHAFKKMYPREQLTALKMRDYNLLVNSEQHNLHQFKVVKSFLESYVPPQKK